MGAGHSWSLSFAFANPKGCYVFVNLPLYKEIFSLDRSAPRKFYLRIVRRFFFNGRDRGGGVGVEPARARERETNRDVGGHDRRPLGLATKSQVISLMTSLPKLVEATIGHLSYSFTKQHIYTAITF